MVKHLDIKIYGQVQGIFFRLNTVGKANELGITGFVRNEPDGTVYIEAEGEKSALDKFVAWCRQGPPLAKVSKVEFSERKVQNFPEFSVER